MELRTVDVAGRSIAYREAGRGAGPPLVFLHGFLCDSRCWEPQLLGLSPTFRVVAWDAPGAGASEDPPETFTTNDYALSLAAFFDAVGITQGYLIGLSWGGILAQMFYRLYSERVVGLVLSDTYAGWKGSLSETVCNERLAACLLDSNGSPESLVAKFLPGLFSDDAPQSLRNEMARIVADFHPVGFRAMSRSSAETDTTDLLPNIGVPTLLLWGADDRRSPLHIARQFQAAIPAAELAIIPSSGHVSNMEQPQAFNDHVRRFCLAASAT
jgi:pimeloyl-ACP methyl ester carboxylesterase